MSGSYRTNVLFLVITIIEHIFFKVNSILFYFCFNHIPACIILKKFCVMVVTNPNNYGIIMIYYIRKGRVLYV